MCDVQWIKLSTDIFSNRKIKQLQYIPNGDTIFFVWIRLLVLAADTNDCGQIYMVKGKPYSRSQLAAVIERSVDVVGEAIKTFTDFDMISIDDGIITIKNWEKYQNIDGMQRIREQNRLRKQRQREKEKVTRDGHGTVTGRHATDKDIDKEKDIDIPKEKNKKKSAKKKKTIEEVLSEREFSDALGKSVHDFIDMRADINKPMSGTALELMLNKLDGMASDEKTKIDILNQSIINGWQGIFDIERGRGNGKKVYQQKMTKNDEEALDFVFGRASS